MNMTGSAGGSGQLALHVPKAPTFGDVVRLGFQQKGLPEQVNNWRRSNRANLFRGLKKVALAHLLKMPSQYGVLYLTVQRPLNPDYAIRELLEERAANYDPSISFPAFCLQRGIAHKSIFLGLASFRVVTTVGVGFIVDAWQNSVELEDMKYHGIGTGVTAEAVGDTTLVTELTTEYNPNSTRATGSLTEGASANIFRTVGTNTVDEVPAAAIREHGIFSNATVAAGVLMDRTLFGAITLGSGDSLQSTYDHTQVAGS